MTSFYLTVAIKLALGLISLVFVINLTGKGNLAPSSATVPSTELCSWCNPRWYNL